MKKFIPLAIFTAVLICFGVIAFTETYNNEKELEKAQEVEEDKIDDIAEEEIDDYEVESNKETADSENKSTIINNYITETEEIAQNEKSESKIKSSFIKLTDFIFYGEEINGVTFKELRTSTKEKLLDLWYKLDNKIKTKYPTAYEEVKSDTTRSYNTIKEKAKSLKDKMVETYKDKAGEERYNKQVDTVESTKEAVKEKASSAKDKVSSWYEEFKRGD